MDPKTAANDPTSAQHDRSSRSPVALRAFFAIAERWQLTADEQMTLLGSPARSTFFKWKKDGGLLPQDTLERISYLIGIFKALQILFPDEKIADEWIRRPNRAPTFNGKSALEHMLAGRVSDLFVVRRVLDAQRGG
jgi:hypothetical protein